MKNKLIIFSAILLISIMVAGGTMAWFTSSPEASITNAQMGIVQVKGIENGPQDISVLNEGTSDCYVRVSLVPQWSDPNLSISGVRITLNDNWREGEDGYYYYTERVGASKERLKILKVGKKTSNFIKSIYIPDIEGETFTLKVVAEGIQSTHKAWKDVWSIINLPF
ncbi:MAG: hypothetical protein RBR71_07730 [Gudongella sp.]|nr:hypothetical protein [Gudongella sp.]